MLVNGLTFADVVPRLDANTSIAGLTAQSRWGQ
jgi:hypothetical protein